MFNSKGRPSLIYAAVFAYLVFSNTVQTQDGVYAAQSQEVPVSQSSSVINDINDLVKEYYPKAKITTSEKKTHFEFKAHERINPYSNRNEMSPDLGGIIGELEIKSGESKDQDKLPTEHHETIHSVLLMAPYSAPDNSHLETRLLFQPDTPNDFMQRFRSVVNGYKKSGATATTTTTAVSAVNEAPTQEKQEGVNSTSSTLVTSSSTLATASTTAALPTSSSTLATATSTTTIPASSSTTSSATFGASKLSKYAYPEGRFRVLLPGSPQMKYTTQAGMRMVDYAYPEAHGTFNISYVILPQALDNSKVPLLFEKISQSFVTSLKGSNTKQSAVSLQSFPGRQIDIGELKDKAGQGALFRIFIVRRFVYVVGVAGKKAWLNSPVANEFLNSFTVTPELTMAEQMQERQRESERKGRSFNDDFAKRRSEFDQRFSESQSRARKDHEKFQADFKNSRWRQ
jgi:hypothetical protein